MWRLDRSQFHWVGTVSIITIAVFMQLIVWVAVEEWHDVWREYATQTQFTGLCAELPDHPECEADPFEYWKFVPWLLGVGSSAATIAIALPVLWSRGE